MEAALVRRAALLVAYVARHAVLTALCAALCTSPLQAPGAMHIDLAFIPDMCKKKFICMRHRTDNAAVAI